MHWPGKKSRIGLSVILGYFICRFTIIAPYKIPTPSMEPSVKVGDIILAFRLSYHLKIPFTDEVLFSWRDPEAGDVIVFTHPRDQRSDMVKRVIGVAGDKVLLKEGIIFLNDQPQTQGGPIKSPTVLDDIFDRPQTKSLYSENLNAKEHWIIRNKSMTPIMPRNWPADGQGFIVSEDCVFVLGDNRDNSLDSRSWGVVPISNIHGKALAVVWSSYNDVNKKWHLRSSRFFSSIE